MSTWNPYDDEVWRYRQMISDHGGLEKLKRFPSGQWEPKSYKQQAAFELASRLELEQRLREVEQDLAKTQYALDLKG